MRVERLKKPCRTCFSDTKLVPRWPDTIYVDRTFLEATSSKVGEELSLSGPTCPKDMWNVPFIVTAGEDGSVFLKIKQNEMVPHTFHHSPR